MKTAVMTFGRMNPPTLGHFHLIRQMLEVPGDHWIFLSHSHDRKKNPLDFETKCSVIREHFAKVHVGHPDVRDIIGAMRFLSGGYDNVVVFAGGDRLAELEYKLGKYNGSEYNFSSVIVKSAGDREGSGEFAKVSATQARDYAKTNNREGFNRISVPGLFDAVKESLDAKAPYEVTEYVRCRL